MSKNKWVSYALFLGLLVLIWLFNQGYIPDFASSNEFNGSHLNRAASEIIYTKHAKCRMGCRHFSKKEVREILEKGKINKRKSKPNDEPCPTYALEGRTSDGQMARMVFATCGKNSVKVITCIDLETDYQCDCY